MAMGEGGPELVKQLLCQTYDINMPGVVAIYPVSYTHLDDGLEIFPGASVFSLKTVNLLDIQVAEREGKWIFHMIET